MRTLLEFAAGTACVVATDAARCEGRPFSEFDAASRLGKPLWLAARVTYCRDPLPALRNHLGSAELRAR